MKLAPFLEKACPALAARWVEAANAVYPLATVGFLRTRQDPFANPVGQRSRELSEIFFAAVIGARHDGGALRTALEEFVRVRAMQDVPAETSLQVMFAYKDIIRAHIQEHTFTLDDEARKELEAMDARCDTLALLAFGGYTRAREAFHNARIADARRRHSQLVRLARRHGLMVADDDDLGGSVTENAGAAPPGSNPVEPAGLP